MLPQCWGLGLAWSLILRTLLKFLAFGEYPYTVGLLRCKISLRRHTEVTRGTEMLLYLLCRLLKTWWFSLVTEYAYTLLRGSRGSWCFICLEGIWLYLVLRAVRVYSKSATVVNEPNIRLIEAEGFCGNCLCSNKHIDKKKVATVLQWIQNKSAYVFVLTRKANSKSCFSHLALDHYEV